MLKLFDETRKHRVFGRGKDWIGSYKIAITRKKKNTYREFRKSGDQNLVPNWWNYI